jgi:ISXO2-like transposase domain/Transposase zinc-ribbon domain
MKLIDVQKHFNTQDKCLDFLERVRWPNGVCCVKCGSLKVSRITRVAQDKNKNNRVYQCLEAACMHQFTATAGTIFHDSHLPLEKWFLAIALITEAKKGISALQLQRHIGVNYRTAWHLNHRIREAMAESGELKGIVEIDETYITPRVRRKGAPKRKKQGEDVVLGMVERGGRLRLIPVPDAKITSLRPVIEKHVSSRAQQIITDEHAIYPFALQRKFNPKKHKTIKHRVRYVDGPIYTNTIENAFSLLKRGIFGTFHKVSIKHLPRYCNEFSYRFNRRENQAGMFEETVKGLVNGKALTLKALTSSSAASV